MTAPNAKHMRTTAMSGTGGRDAIEYSNNNHEMDIVHGRRVTVKADNWERRLMTQTALDVQGPVRIVRCARVTYQRPKEDERMSSWLPYKNIAEHIKQLSNLGMNFGHRPHGFTNAKGKVIRVERAWMVTAPPNANYIWNDRRYAEATLRALQYHHARWLLRQPV